VPIILARIDDRLIHGQVIVGWARVLEIQHILVVSDAIAGDAKQQALFKMAVPPTLKVSVAAVAEAAAWLQAPGAVSEKLMLLFPSVREAAGLIERGYPIQSLNIGGLRFEEGKRQVLKSVSLSDEDIAIFRRLAQRGVALEVRAAFNDEKTALGPYLADDRSDKKAF